MPGLKLGPIPDDRPIRMTIAVSPELLRSLTEYAEAASAEAGRKIDPAKLVPLIVARFIASDRSFARLRERRNGPNDGTFLTVADLEKTNGKPSE